jgi:transmembrane 9 superfamily protein 2/4
LENKQQMRAAFVVTAAVLCAALAEGFYLPNMEAVPYKASEEVTLMANVLRSNQEMVPFEYYHLPFCKPDPTKMKVKPESMGELLVGDKMQTSPYTVKMKENVGCAMATQCSAANQKKVREQLPLLTEFIDNAYRGHLSIDSLPGYNNGTRGFLDNCKGTQPVASTDAYQRGYALGIGKWCIGETIINNHLHFNIKYHQPDPKVDEYRVVGFTIEPLSVRHNDDHGDCDANWDYKSGLARENPLFAKAVANGTKLHWTYSTTWINEPNYGWSLRWEAYLNSSYADRDERSHWIYILNSLAIAVCLSIIAGTILMRTLHKDFNTYNNADPDAAQEEVGWKLVHTDVFRPPKHSALLCIVAGTGVQLLFMIVGALIFAVLGFLSPANRGTMLSTLILLFVLMSVMAGYACALLLKMFDNKQWKIVFGCAVMGPGIIMTAWLIINVFNWHAGASDAVPFVTLATLLAMWLLCGVPLVVLGAAFAFRQEVIVNPCRVGKLAREVPDQRWYLSAPFLYVVPATVPFGCALLELRFIWRAMWQGLVYYVFGFLAIIFIVWVVTIALTTVIALYYQLCFENYRWWWRAFVIPSAFGLHLFLFSMYYYSNTLNIKSKTGVLLYFTYSALLSGAYALAAGTVGFLSAFAFVRKIYGSIKID